MVLTQPNKDTFHALARQQLHLSHQLEEHKLDQIAERKIRIPLSKPCKATASLKKKVQGQI